METTFGGKSYPVAYTMGAIIGVQESTDEQDMDSLFVRMKQLYVDKDGVLTRHDLNGLLKMSAIVTYHGIECACLKAKTQNPFSGWKEVAASMDSGDMVEAGKQVMFFCEAMLKMYGLNTEDEKKPQGENTSPLPLTDSKELPTEN